MCPCWCKTLAKISASWKGIGNHTAGSGEIALTYDAAGQLIGVREDCSYADLRGYGREITTGLISVDLQTRLIHAEHETQVSGNPYPGFYDCSDGLPLPYPRLLRGSIDWTYDSFGFMKTAGGDAAYVASADGWLLSRRVGTQVNTYAVTRDSGGRVLEERFTQAEPRSFYGDPAPQRIRYQEDKFPTEPLFVPRAPTGRNGADYFGVISSHHR